jgi:hypothetical protein
MDQNLKMSERRALLRAFVESDAKLAHYFHEMYHNNPRLVALESFLRQCKSKKSDSMLGLTVVAEKLLLLRDVLEGSDAMCNPRRGSRTEPKAIRDLRRYNEAVRARAVAELGKEKSSVVKGKDVLKKNYRRNNFNEMGELIQSRIVRLNKRGWVNNIDTVHPCPYCSHELLYCMSSAEDHAELVFGANESWKKRLEEWKMNGSNKKTKPRKPAQPKRMMACMCVVQKCVSTETGKGCTVCRNFNTNGIKVPYDYTSMRCTCGVCQCKCDAVFRREDWEDIYTQVQMKKKEKERQGSGLEKHAKGSCKCFR